MSLTALSRSRAFRILPLFMAATMTYSASAAGLSSVVLTVSESAARAKVTANKAGWVRAELHAVLLSGESTNTAAQALPPSPGAALPWQPSFQVYKGQANLATGNLTLAHAVTGWTALGPGVNLALYYNSQGTRTGSIGAKWSHSYETRIIGTSPAVLVRGDGREITYALSNGAYVAPAGFYETLTRATNGTWTLTYKDGSTQVFDTNGRLTSIADINGNATTLTYGANGLQTVTDAAGRNLTFAYTSGKLSGVTDPEGRTWGFTYDASGRLSGVVDPPLNGSTATTAFAWNASSLITGVTDRLGNTWNYAYGANATFYTVTDPLGKVAGSVNAVPAAPDTMGFSSQSTAATATPDNIQSTYPVNTVATAYVEDAGGNAREYGLDSQGRITAARDGSGHQTNFTWDSQNNRTSVVEPGGATTTMAYDVRGNVTSITDPSNRTISRTYDVGNNLLTEADPAGNQTVNTYDVKNNLLTTTDATNRTETRTYNSNGTLASSTDAAGKTTSYTYNSAGDRTSLINPLGQTTSWSYTLGRVTSRTDAIGRTTAYNYDAWKRLTGIDYPQSTDQSFTYDLEGRMTQSVDGTGTRTYTYDALGRKTNQVDPRGTTVATYDNASRLKTQTDPTGRLIQYAYDGDGQLTGVSDPTSWATYIYDARHRLSTVSYSNGTTSTYGYDPAGRTTSLVHRGPGNVVIGSYSSSYDTAGRLSQTVEGPQSATTTYGYDASGRLLSENRAGASPYVSTYTYESRGLRATAFRSENGVASHNGTYTYDNAGRLTSVTDTVTASGLAGSYAWNADGTLASMPGPGYTRTLSYDEEGRLTGISKLQGSVTTPLFQYGYGFDGGRRWRKDLANNVWDWYPCGVACCAGDLVTLRSTDGGTTWSTLETRLDKAVVLNSSPFLASSGTGNIRIGSESAVLDTFGVRRAGSYGSGLTSLLFPLRADEAVENDLLALALAPQNGLDDPFTKAMCRALCLSLADANGDGKIGPIERKRIYDPCVLACERLGAKGTKRMWCKGIESLIDHLLRHPKEGYKGIKNKQLLESLLALWNGMGCPGEPPSID